MAASARNTAASRLTTSRLIVFVFSVKVGFNPSSQGGLRFSSKLPTKSKPLISIHSFQNH
jgi:hypothetical protein